MKNLRIYIVLIVVVTFFTSCNGTNKKKSDCCEKKVEKTACCDEKKAEKKPCCGDKTKTATKPCSEKKNIQKKPCCGDKVASNGVKVYYFHGTRRCATCKAVEAVTLETVSETFGDKVAFISIDRDQDKENPLIEKYHVTGQTLLVVNGDQKENLTNVAFMNAKTHPEKLKAKIIETVETLK
ncbi:nitrophenyl compound nitroreductase subunit ArsF family protein [Halosquirtibacter xylanolyticus]|uniref:nitrophenyl compound nitroreductase subunit ArsF family protein n=1 Tax=Halosquirtibacter xylanolyticus TaxID=3374599 RepID=UPI00374927A1|nr:nitrophenyl compound nitroreductase subunit ArsF family protein [Prolixibacteraceae bacterium]